MNFDEKATIYEEISISQKIAAEHLLSMMDISSDDSILDVGCGTGYLTDLIYKKAKNIQGIDLSSQMIEQAQLLRPHIHFSVFNAEKLDEYAKYNWIVTNAVTYYFKDLQGTLRKFYNALKENGRYALQAQTTVTPQFTKAMTGLLNCQITRAYFANFKLLINHLNINEFLALLISLGFTIQKAEMINYKSKLTVDDAFSVFKSGTATPFLDPENYGRELSLEYKNYFWEIVYNGIKNQAIDNLITLDIPRCFIIAEKDGGNT